MLVPLAVLALGAAFAGVAFRHWFIGGGFEGFWRNSLFIGQGNHILEEMEHVPALVSLSPTLMMLGGLVVAYYMYLVDKTAPKRLADAFPAALPLPAQQVVLRRALRLDLRPAGLRHRPPVLEGRRRRDHRWLRSGRNLRPRPRRDAQRRAAAVRLHLSIRLRDAARRGGARDLVSVRRGALMSGSWLLSGLLILPLLGVGLHPPAARRERGDQAQRALDRALRHDHHLRAEPRRLGAFQSRPSPASSSSRSTTGSRTPFSTSSASTACRCPSSC